MKSWVHVRSESDATIAYMGVQRASYMVVAAACLVPLAAVVSCSSSSASVAVACGGQGKPPYRLGVFFRPGVTYADARRVVDHCASGSTISLRQQVTTRADRVRITVFTSEMAFRGHHVSCRTAFSPVRRWSEPAGPASAVLASFHGGR